MIEVGYNTYRFTLFPLIILFVFLILIITKQLRNSVFPVEIPSKNTFQIYFLFGTFGWLGAFASELGLISVPMNFNITAYVISTLLLFIVASDHIKSLAFKASVLASHLLLIAFLIFENSLYTLVETVSWYILLVYPLISFYFARKALNFRNKGYILCALGGFLIVMMAPFQLHALYNDYDVYLAYQLGFLITPIGFIIVGLGYLTTILINEHQLLQSMAFSDPLTEVLNRRGLNHSLKTISEMNKRKNTPLSLALIDIDHFKNINDEFGHSGGDAALKQVAKTFLLNARSSDMLCRLGGDEFVLVMPETNLESAMLVADRIKDNVNKTAIEILNNQFHVNLSMGIVCKYGEIDLDFLIHQADVALYKSKQMGRNTISTADFSQ